jgi:hypothetical protein
MGWMNFSPCIPDVPCLSSQAQHHGRAFSIVLQSAELGSFYCSGIRVIHSSIFFASFARHCFVLGIYFFLIPNQWLLHHSLSLQKLIYLLPWTIIPLPSTSVTMSPNDLCLSQISFCDRPKMLE